MSDKLRQVLTTYQRTVSASTPAARDLADARKAVQLCRVLLDDLRAVYPELVLGWAGPEFKSAGLGSFSAVQSLADLLQEISRELSQLVTTGEQPAFRFASRPMMMNRAG